MPDKKPCPTCNGSGDVLDDGSFVDPHKRIEFLEHALKARDRILDKYETDFEISMSETPENIIKAALGIDVVEGVTVEFVKIERSGRIRIAATDKDGEVILDGVTAAITSDSLDREMKVQELCRKLAQVSRESAEKEISNEEA